MKHYKLIFGKLKEINVKQLYNYIHLRSVWIYDNNLNKQGILYY